MKKAEKIFGFFLFALQYIYYETWTCDVINLLEKL